MTQQQIISLPSQSTIRTQTKISGIAIVFDWDHRDRGNSGPLGTQADVVEAYGQRLIEELEFENVRCHIVDTRKGDSKSDIQKMHDIPDGFVPIFVSCGWHDKPRPYNASIVEFSGPHYKFAERIADSLSEWGRCYVFGHKVSRPIAVEECAKKSFIRIKPISLNGPHADEYIRRMDSLGETIGRAIGEFLSARGEGLRR